MHPSDESVTREPLFTIHAETQGEFSPTFLAYANAQRDIVQVGDGP